MWLDSAHVDSACCNNNNKDEDHVIPVWRGSLVEIEIESDLRLVFLHFLLVISIHRSIGRLLTQTQVGYHCSLLRGSLPSSLLLRPVVRLQGETKHLRLVHLCLLVVCLEIRQR